MAGLYGLVAGICAILALLCATAGAAQSIPWGPDLRPALRVIAAILGAAAVFLAYLAFK
jgi:hypothetical protein